MMVRPRLEGKQQTPLSSRVATCISWRPEKASDVDIRRGTESATVAATRSGNKLTQKDNVDSGVQFITPASPGQSLLLAKDPGQHL